MIAIAKRYPLETERYYYKKNTFLHLERTFINVVWKVEDITNLFWYHLINRRLVVSRPQKGRGWEERTIVKDIMPILATNHIYDASKMATKSAIKTATRDKNSQKIKR